MRILKSELTQHSCSSTFSYSFLEQLDEFHLLVYILSKWKIIPWCQLKRKDDLSKKGPKATFKIFFTSPKFPNKLLFIFFVWLMMYHRRSSKSNEFFFFRKNDLPVVKIPSRTAMLLYFMLQYKPLNKITFKLYTTFFLGKKKRKQLLKFSWWVQFKTWYTRIL